MKTRPGYFFWILALAFTLMAIIVAAQVLTKKNITGLKKGNQDALRIFTINNRFEELVNLSFELNTKITTTGELPFRRQSLIDSLNMLGYNATVLQRLGMQPETKANFDKLNNFIDTEVEAGHTIVNAARGLARATADSLSNKKIADSIYNAALAIQKLLEKDMQSTLGSNTTTSARLSALNKTLALIAITAILILCAIIINRHLKQVHLIKELEKATAAAKESASIKEQFLANMSHEIRTPLNAIKGFSRLLSLTPLTGEQKEYADIINESSGNLLTIVNDILDISKMEAQKLRIENRPFDLKRLLATLKGMFRKQAEDKGLQYIQRIAEHVPSGLKGDPDRLLQILINLVSNAVKFTQAGKIEILVNQQQLSKEIAVLEFVVSDTGVGIPEGKQHVIFTRFEQLQTTQGDLMHGTGLGLSIVKNLAELMGGSVSVSSQEQGGATFNVVLPFEIYNGVLGKEGIAEEADITPAKVIYSQTSVLVVEDNSINQLLIRKILTDIGVGVTIASNGQEALDAILQTKFDLVFLDIQMPVMDGYTAAQKMRERNITTPVIAMTAFALPGEKERCIAAGMNDYLAKPVDVDQVYKILSLYLSAKQAKQVPTTADVNFDNLLKLTGGDQEMSEKILTEIAKEIPLSVLKLKQLQTGASPEDVQKICHHMLSSYSPIGENTNVVKRIKVLNEAAVSKKPDDVAVLTEELLQALYNLQNELSTIKV